MTSTPLNPEEFERAVALAAAWGILTDATEPERSKPTTSTPLTLDELKRFRSIVETGTPLDKRTVLNIISHAGQLQEHFDEALAANQALVEQLARVKEAADTYQTLYEQRAESLEQAEQERDEWRGRFDEVETSRIAEEQAVDRIRELRDKWDTEGMRYWINADAAVIALDFALEGKSVGDQHE